MKTVDFKQTLYGITEKYPETIPLLVAQGFAGVANEKMRTTHAKEMTVITGCDHLGIDVQKVARALKEKGFTVKNCPGYMVS